MTNRNGTVIQWNGDGKPSSIGNVGFVYDGLGSRLKKLSGGQTTKYVGGNYEIAPNGTVTKYLAGGKQVGTSFFILHRDHLGSLQAVTDGTGLEVRRLEHKPLGDQHYASGSHAESKGWIDEREEETELVYLNARYYDPEIGRFTAADPIATPGQGLNRYSYSWNNPDPCAGMTEEQCSEYLNNNPVVTIAAICEEHPDFSICDPFYSEPDGGPPATMDMGDDCAMLPGIAPEGCYGLPGPSEEPLPVPPVSGSDPPVSNTPQPDNPLYNCQNGLKTNCPGNRSGGNGGHRNVTPVQVGVEWLTGKGPRVRHFVDGDRFTELLRRHDNIQALVLGVRDGTLPLRGRWDYSLSGLQGVPKYFSDYSTLLTAGLTGNLAVTYLGSYHVMYEVTDGILHITAWNFSTISSATHPPVVGYWAIWDNVGQALNSFFSTGPMSPTGQVFHFHEYLGQ